MAIILVVIGGYFIDGYWWLLKLLYQWLLVTIILMDIDGYSIINHWWLLMAIDDDFIGGN